MQPISERLCFKWNKNKLVLVPPCMHSVNATEKAIDSYQICFVEGIASVHPCFQGMCGLSRPSIFNPKLPAEEFLNGVIDHDKMPMSPPRLQNLGLRNARKKEHLESSCCRWLVHRHSSISLSILHDVRTQNKIRARSKDGKNFPHESRVL